MRAVLGGKLSDGDEGWQAEFAAVRLSLASNFVNGHGNFSLTSNRMKRGFRRRIEERQ